MKILIDNGHGENTPGKRSPDGRLQEWAYTREIADMVVFVDVPLSERCKRANNIYRDSQKNAILVSIHCNAAGNGTSWMNARGWGVYVSDNASFNSKRLASSLAQAAISKGVTVRKQTPDVDYWVQNLAICRDTNCPAILTENFFQDNKEDVEFLLSAEGKRTVANIHIEGIINYLNSK